MPAQRQRRAWRRERGAVCAACIGRCTQPGCGWRAVHRLGPTACIDLACRFWQCQPTVSVAAKTLEARPSTAVQVNLQQTITGISASSINTNALASAMQQQLAQTGVSASVLVNTFDGPAAAGRRLKQDPKRTTITYTISSDMSSASAASTAGVPKPDRRSLAGIVARQAAAVASAPALMKQMLQQAVPADVLLTVDLDLVSGSAAVAATPATSTVAR
jgi:hypothetical protein